MIVISIMTRLWTMFGIVLLCLSLVVFWPIACYFSSSESWYTVFAIGVICSTMVGFAIIGLLVWFGYVCYDSRTKLVNVGAAPQTIEA